MSRSRPCVLLLAAAGAAGALALAGCERKQPPSPRPVTAPARDASAAARHTGLSRDELNRAAVRLDLPLYWVRDADGDGAVDAAEVATLLFYPDTAFYVKDGQLTPAFDEAFARLREWAGEPPLPQGLQPADLERRRLVIEELDQGVATLVRTDAAGFSDADHQLVEHVLAAARLIDQLHARQLGLTGLEERIPPGDPASRSLFRRNWGPACVAPRTEKNPACSAIPGAPRPRVDVYPAALQESDPLFCGKLEKRPDAATLFDPFSVVREQGGKLVAVPYTQAYAELMGQVAGELEAAAAVLPPGETAFAAYLRAAAGSFRSNDWRPADEAWARMNAENSRFYLRVAPDEVYWDPCARKAGFHVSFALINPDSLTWQRKLAPLQQAMEDTLARIAGAPYAAHPVTFHLPDFIDIIANAGDSRDPLGATVGQSLPNWGPVANQGRGRTVVMSNLYTDEDSLRTRRRQGESLFDAATLESWSDPGAELLATILHEATHNLGPAHEYRVRGKTDDEVFGGSLATIMEELKAETGALYFVGFLRERGVIDEKLARKALTYTIFWTFGQISRGMYTDGGKPKHYGQVAAIQLGYLIDKGGVTFDPAAPAPNGEDRGVFTIHFDAVGPAVEELLKITAGAKARGERAVAEGLVKRYVDGEIVPRGVIAERMLRDPKSSFVYSVSR